MGVVFVILFALIMGGIWGFSIGFFIFSLVLNHSNNIGDKRVSDVPYTSQFEVTSRADKIPHRTEIFQQQIESGMMNLINSPEYRAIMEQSVRRSDDELVSHENNVKQ